MKNKCVQNHEINRSKICVLCLSRSTARNSFLNIKPKGQIEIMLNKHFKYNANDTHLPCGICSTCRNKLYRYEYGKLEIICVPDLSVFYVRKIQTRSTVNNLNGTCDCPLCDRFVVPAPEIVATDYKKIEPNGNSDTFT